MTTKKKKHLVFLTIFHKPESLKLLYMLLESMYLFGDVMGN